MGAIIFSGLVSIGLIWAIRALARSEFWGMAGACFFAAIVTVLSVFPFRLFFQAVALQSALTFLLLFGCIVCRRNLKSVVPVCIAATLASYGFFFVNAYSGLQELSKLRVQYPLQSVSDRLAYEAKATERLAHGEIVASPQPILSERVEQHLVANEERRTQADSRRWGRTRHQ